MKQLIKTVFPKEFFTNPAYFRALVLAVVYVGVAIAQLFTYEKFASVLASYTLPGGEVTANVLAALLPLITVAALPYLLSMRSVPMVRQASRVAVLAAPALWLVLAVWANVASGSRQQSVGIFGATLAAPVGLWFVAFTLLWVWSAVLIVRELPPRKSIVG